MDWVLLGLKATKNLIAAFGRNKAINPNPKRKLHPNSRHQKGSQMELYWKRLTYVDLKTDCPAICPRANKRAIGLTQKEFEELRNHFAILSWGGTRYEPIALADQEGRKSNTSNGIQ
ncbi:MAG: hypothetical protein H8E10_16350 [Desulfobacterales bacterium]|nr:hypothetical protein [Desulfobacterales bacterium]